MPTRATEGVSVQLLGDLRVERAGRPISLPASKRTRALLGYLVAVRTSLTRAHLCDLLWEGPDDPRAALRWSLTKLRPIVNDLEAVFIGRIGGDTLFLRTNWNAPNSRIMAVDLRDPARDNWRVVVPEGKSVISALALAGGQVFVSRLEDVQPKIQSYTPDGKLVRDVVLPGIGSVSGIGGEWDQDEAFFSFSSFAQPQTIYRHRVATGQADVWARLAVPVKADAVEVRQVFFSSKDGTRVPMFVAFRKGLPLDGKRPTLLTAYGGFNQPQLPAFSARAAFWIENGGVYALANLRGGGEYGEAWHHAGMLEKKQNVFDDFIAAGEWLIANRYASRDTLAISGASNGGLLVGAAMTQRPELFRAVVCSYPLWTCCATTSSSWRATGCRSTGPRTIRRSFRPFGPTRPITTWRRASAIRPCCSSLVTAIRGSRPCTRARWRP